MALRPVQGFKQTDVRNFIRKKIEVIESVVKDQLIDAAEQFVADARSVNTYKDRTSNLRGSIGYVLLKDGNDVFGNFEGAQIGQQKARQLTSQIKSEHPKGYVLIVVAGMDYALYVESKGYDVITGSSQEAEDNLQQQFNRLKQQLKKVK